MTQSFPADSALQKLIDYLEQEKGYRSGAFTLSTTFPRKTFTSQDYSKSFKELGLVPSAALILTGSARQV